MSTATTTESETIRGAVHKTFYSSPTFSAGILRTDDGAFVKFRGRFCANKGDVVAVVGQWTRDKKYGRQFDVQGLSYDLPESNDGLVAYLADHPAFKGVGVKTAERIVEYAGDGQTLDRLIRDGIGELHQRLRIPMATLVTLRDAWIANSDENRVRAYLAQFDLTPHQMDVLLSTFGNGIVGVLRCDPYVLIKHVNGYGFKRVDKIARKMGTRKEHPGRIEAALAYCLSEEIGSGHTWTAGHDLVNKANEVLVLDTLDSLDLIRSTARAMLERGDLDADGQAVSTPAIRSAEQLIHNALQSHAWSVCPFAVVASPPAGLNPGQREAFSMAMSNAVSVISGGAGVGKTFVVAQLAKAFQAARLSVALCAPTGKAAKRIEELMRQHGVDLEASTIHRLLEYNGHEFKRDSLSEAVRRVDASGIWTESPAFHVVIVDEVSMVDVPLMAELLRRIDLAKTRLILVGDHNQLPPVGPGNVLRDIIHGQLAHTKVLTDVVRQAGILKVNSTAILSGTVAPTAVNDPAWVVIDHFREAQHIQTYLRDLVLKLIPERLGYDPVLEVQIVTPMHNGPLGTKALNSMMQFLLFGRVDEKFAVGDKVIQAANDYDMGVMNGTIGRVVDFEDGGYLIDFDGVGCRTVDGERLGKVQLAYALTAHKAQGSEFPCVVVVCHKSHFFADRNWLYTAVTRAAKTCILVGDRWGLRHAAGKNNTIKRRTFLSRWADQDGGPL
ncbi:MAG: ATP-dependent RecD-like DNA helicase [Phycisphaerae bacterium]|nr:ATP-dependent RecD-like DNA helicase [Phycisphaerae bacterium]